MTHLAVYPCVKTFNIHCCYDRDWYNLLFFCARHWVGSYRIMMFIMLSYWYNIIRYYTMLAPHGFSIVLISELFDEMQHFLCQLFFNNYFLNLCFVRIIGTNKTCDLTRFFFISRCDYSHYRRVLYYIHCIFENTTPKIKPLKFKRPQLSRTDKIITHFWSDWISRFPRL